MPPAIFAFGLCAFALGFTEFVVIGLAIAIAKSLGHPVEDLGMAVTTYAVGVAIGAPVLTALSARLSRKRVLAATMLTFICGNAGVACSNSLEAILLWRLVTGLTHGVFLAVASSVAAALVPPTRSGRALAVVFGGLTVALVAGVPVGTYVGSVWDWRAVFWAVSAFAVLGLVGLLAWTPPGTGDGTTSTPMDGLRALAAPVLLKATTVTVLAFGGAFVLFTYASQLLTTITGLGIESVSAVLLAYGLAAAVGNFAGGVLSDRLGHQSATASVLIMLALILVGIGLLAEHPLPTAILIAALGAAMFAAGPVLQARVLDVAGRHAPEAVASASGLNIAGFNLGVTLGSLVGGAVVADFGVAATPFVGAAIVAVSAVLVIGRSAARASARRAP
jgi:MFS transporter, DHA1 family, inner membrane transport protein